MLHLLLCGHAVWLKGKKLARMRECIVGGVLTKGIIRNTDQVKKQYRVAFVHFSMEGHLTSSQPH